VTLKTSTVQASESRTKCQACSGVIVEVESNSSGTCVSSDVKTKTVIIITHDDSQTKKLQ
jgi:hypothetical protein